MACRRSITARIVVGSGLARLGDERLTGWNPASSAEAPVSASVSSVVLRDMFPVSSAIEIPTGSLFLVPVRVQLTTRFSLLIRCIAAKEGWARAKRFLTVMAESLRLVSSSFSSLSVDVMTFALLSSSVNQLGESCLPLLIALMAIATPSMSVN